MPKNKKLSDFEKGQIDSFKKMGWSDCRIATEIGRSPTVVHHYVRNPQGYGLKHSPGRPKSLTKREELEILRKASNSMQSCNEILQETKVKCSKRTFQRVISSAKHLKYKKLECKPPLSEKHIAARLAFCNDHITWTKEWQKVIFSDEKKFNLDGPDGWKYYWHDLRKNDVILSKRQQCGGSVKIWAAIGYKRKSDIVFVENTMDSVAYTNMLSKQFPRYGRMMAGN